MDFFLIPNNPENSVLVSANGVAHYQIRTAKLGGGVRVTHIQRPADSTEDSIVAEIEWKSWETPTIIRSPLLGGLGRCVGKAGVGVRAHKFLYRRRKLSPYVGHSYTHPLSGCYQPLFLLQSDSWKHTSGPGISLGMMEKSINGRHQKIPDVW
jgi:hypothetical protein